MRQVSTLSQSLPAAENPHLPPDQVIIGGVALELDALLNSAFFAPKTVESLASAFRTNTPFPHLVFEGLFDPRLLELMHSEFDNLKWSNWRHYDNTNERKRGSLPNTRFGNATQLYFNTIHSGRFVNFLQRITGIASLIPDPELFAGGLHDIPQGGKFALHTDFNQHAVTKLDNRLVFITYLNKDWKASYGGALELWSIEEDKCKAEIEPVFGRSILFYQSSKSLHGHPQPVNAPDGRSRRSAAAYFYSNGRSDDESTSFHTTLFPKPVTLSRRQKIVNTIKYLTPPFIVDAVRKTKAILR
jgi:Rps23 Pro-64 3,4-dihydroxylase Tpa1-like proline 4-hydroxylase